MQTIKFRVWDSVDKEITEFEKIRILPHEKNLCHIFEDDRYCWLQFTGVSDESGVEIYKGDILEIGYNNLISNGKGDTVKYEVRVEGCDFILYRPDLKLIWGRLSRLEELGWKCRVVGNIFKNAELLIQK